MLSTNYVALKRRYDVLVDQFEDIKNNRTPDVRHRMLHWRTLEGILSTAWQSWCGFSRSTLMKSCFGTVTKSGTVVPPTLGALSEGRVAYVAKCLTRSNPVKPGRVLQTFQEPTWGDRQIVLEAARHFSLANVSSLELGLLLTTRAADDMRIVRNATAHLSKEAMDKVQQLSPYYTGSSLRHPTDFMFWKDNSSGETSFILWLSDLLDCADLMVN